MKQLFRTIVRKLPKYLVPVAAIATAAIAIPAVLFAWGPSQDRALFTAENPAPYVTFNSITNNPEVGDERNFLTVKDASDTTPGNWKNDLIVTPGKEYLVRVYVHNDAASNLNLKATNSRVKVSVPTNTAKEIGMSGFISADNAKPQEVWADSVLRSSSDFNIAYVDGSARLYNKAFGQTGTQLSDDIVTNKGALLGYDKLDGVIPGCIEYSGYVSFKIRIQGPSQANFDFKKDVRMAGSTDKYTESVAAKPGDKVEFRLSYKNTSQVAMNDVLVKDTLPQGLTYVPGTAKMYNANYPYPNGWQITEDLFKGGSNIGTYSPNANALVVFTAQVASNDALPTCGPNMLHNIAKVTTDYGTKEDSADVTVPKECKPKAKYACDSLTVAKIERTKFKFDAKYTVQNATLKSIQYVVRDEAGKEIARQTSPDYTQDKVGKYTVEAIVTVTVDGQDKVATGNCKQPFEVTKVNECKPGIPVGDKRCEEKPECKPGVPVGDDRCNPPVERCTVPGKETLPKNSPDCVTPTPPELPHTGAGDGIIALIGAGSLIAAIGYYVASRRAIGA